MRYYNQESTFAEILTAIKANDNKAVDDHRGGRSRDSDQRVVHAIAKYGVHTVMLLSAEETSYFCLNRMYVEDGVAHLDTTSVGGVLDMAVHGTLEEAIKQHNDPKNWVAGYDLKPITDVTYI